MENFSKEILNEQITAPGTYVLTRSKPFNVKGDDIEITGTAGECIPVKVTDMNPAMTIEGENIKFTRVVFDIEFLDISADDDREYNGVLCKNCKNLTFEKCVLIVRHNQAAGKVKSSEYPISFDPVYKDDGEPSICNIKGLKVENSEGVRIDSLTDFRQHLPNGIIVRRIIGTNGVHQLYINDVPVVTPVHH